jgi:hypothetical protein
MQGGFANRPAYRLLPRFAPNGRCGELRSVTTKQIAPPPVILIMKSHILSITKDDETFQFEINDYPHYEHHTCKFDVYQNGVFVAGFNPDDQHILQICKDSGTVDPGVLTLLAEEIEAHNWV